MSCPAKVSPHNLARIDWGSFMRQRTRGWIMPEADIRSLLRLIDERISSPKVEVRHRDALIRLRDILEDDLRMYRSGELPKGSQPRSGQAILESLAMDASFSNTRSLALRF